MHACQAPFQARTRRESLLQRLTLETVSRKASPFGVRRLDAALDVQACTISGHGFKAVSSRRTAKCAGSPVYPKRAVSRHANPHSASCACHVSNPRKLILG